MATKSLSKARRLMIARLLRRRSAANDAAAELKRKNFELDQHRIDLVKDALGAKTETEALTLAMDVALEMSAFATEVRRGSARLLGAGGFTNRFDDEAALDFSGFDRDAPAAPVSASAVGRKVGARR